MMHTILNRRKYQTLKALIIVQLEANEKDDFDPNVWKTLAETVEQRGGHLLIIGTEDIPGHSFKRQLWEILNGYDSVAFIKDEDAETSIPQYIHQLKSGK